MKKIVLLSAFLVFGLSVTTAQETTVATKVKSEVKKKSKKAKKVKESAISAVQGAGMLFDSETIDYGEIDQDANGERQFTFVNNGTQPLIITNAQGSCGCTVPTFPKEPIAPGAKGVIGVKYDTHRVGSFQKTVTITSNFANQTITVKEPSVVSADKKPEATGTPKVLTIKGSVKAKPEPVKTEEIKVQEVKS